MNNDNKIKHLEMVQDVIKRMASNSFILKGWAVTLVVYTAPTATAARTFCPPLPLTAHGHCPAKYDILDMARQ